MQISNYVTIKSGKRIPKGYQLTNKKNGHPYIKVKDMGNYKTKLNDTFEYVPDNIFSKIEKYTVKTGDVILSIVGTIGNVSIIDKSLNNANLTENCVKLIPNEYLLSKYLYYFLISYKGKDEIIKGIIGSTQPKLPFYNIEKIDIDVPDIIAQQHIVDTIGSIDDLIEKYQNKNTNLDQIITKYVNELVCISTNTTTFKDYVVEETKRQGDFDYQLLSVVSSGEIIKQGDFFIKDTSSKDRKKYKIVEPYHFAFNPARANIGSIGMYNSKMPGCISPIYSVFKVKDKYDIFFNYYLKTDYVKNEIIKKSSGSVRQNLPFNEFKKIIIPNISDDAIETLNKKILPIWNLINQNKLIICKLEFLKEQYLNKFFN